MLLLCVFLLFLSRLSHRSKIYWGAFFVGVVFVLSSWEIWWYGGSFGQRAMIEYYGILFLPFAIGLEHISSRLKTIVISVALMVLLLNQFQTYQYRYHIIHWEDMNRERYIDRFWELPE
jgi:hypothetical protein